MADDPSAPQVVVGAAVVREGRLLAARRTTPAELAGRWELPGGKVEPGESDGAALLREIAEELGVRIAIERWLPGEQTIRAAAGAADPSLVLRVAVVGLVSGEPRSDQHDRLRWLTRAELDDVDWLDADRPFLAAAARELVP